MSHHSDFGDLFKEDTRATVSLSQSDANELKTSRIALEHALVRYQDGETQTNADDKTPYWDCLRRHLSQDKLSIILGLASRHSLAWTNQFIGSLIQFNADTQTFTINTNRLETLIFLQKYCGLQSRDLSVTTSPYTLLDDVRLFERPIEGDNFNQDLLDEVYGFLKKLKDSQAINWVVNLVKLGFLNFSMLHKKIALGKEPFLAWLTQWNTSCLITIASDIQGADNRLGIHQRTIQHMVRYGLSPKWLKENASLSVNDATGTTSDMAVANNRITFDSALEYHQSQEVHVYQNTENEQLEQPIVDGITSNINDTTPKWLKKYTDPEDQWYRQLN